jgi:gluconokinase
MSTSQALQLVIMGVSGCGKSTFAKAISDTLHLSLMDGDDLHSPQSVAKMQAGIPLEDTDRWPWLDRIGNYLANPLGTASLEHGRVVACSALKLAYRAHIRRLAPNVRFIFLDGDSELIRSRMAARAGHFMQLGLLDSQLRTLERPTVQEQDVLTVDTAHSVEDLLAFVIPALQADKRSEFPSNLQVH